MSLAYRFHPETASAVVCLRPSFRPGLETPDLVHVSDWLAFKWLWVGKLGPHRKLYGGVEVNCLPILQLVGRFLAEQESSLPSGLLGLSSELPNGMHHAACLKRQCALRKRMARPRIGTQVILGLGVTRLLGPDQNYLLCAGPRGTHQPERPAIIFP